MSEQTVGAVADMATPCSAPNSTLDRGTSPTPATAGLLTNSTFLTLLPLPALVTAVAQSTTSGVERMLDQHFTSLLHQQQQLVPVVQQLARPQAAVSLSSLSSNPPTGEGGIRYGAKVTKGIRHVVKGVWVIPRVHDPGYLGGKGTSSHG